MDPDGSNGMDCPERRTPENLLRGGYCHAQKECAEHFAHPCHAR